MATERSSMSGPAIADSLVQASQSQDQEAPGGNVPAQGDIQANENPDGSTYDTRDSYLKLHEAHNHLHGLHNSLNTRFDNLGNRMAKLERRLSVSTVSSLADSDAESIVDDEDRLGYEEPTIPDVRDVNFEHFKNRYTETEGKHCIEVLVSNSDLSNQEEEERLRRGEVEAKDRSPPMSQEETSDEPFIRRVRIQSPALLLLLYRFSNSDSLTWTGLNRCTFFRPFAWFISTHEAMKQKLEELEKKFQDVPPESRRTLPELVEQLLAERNELRQQHDTTATPVKQPEPEATVAPANGLSAEEKPVTPGEPEKEKDQNRSLRRKTDKSILERALMESYQTLLELRCYVDFVATRILPQLQKYDDPEKPEAQKVRYEDLWYLFRPGELVYVPDPLGKGKSKAPANRQDNPKDSTVQEDNGLPHVYRLVQRWKPDATSNQLEVPCRPWRSSRRDVKPNFDVSVYSIQFDGTVYGPRTTASDIETFSGLRDVTSLHVYPLRYHPDRVRIAESLKKNGLMFREAVKTRHMIYCGWSLIEWLTPKVTPPGANFKPVEVPNPTRYIESDVIVDFKEALQAYPRWRPPLMSYVRVAEHWFTCEDRMEIIQWSDRSRKEKLSTFQDLTQDEDGTDSVEWNRNAREDPFSKPTSDPIFKDEDLMLLPKRLFAYALRERKFFQIDLQYIQKLGEADRTAFDNLKIDPTHMRIVKSVVASHFQKKELEKKTEIATIMDQDLVRGKGRGLVILLHGAPGVGKTATAEAVAQWHNKPLFAITCGDLGFTPDGIESSLSEIFRLAHLWNCVLLLDEADVFLSQREKTDLKRNALVSVFLRVLEYYNGIIFLTTNRVGTLDEAFKSRVHLSLHYPSLDRQQTVEILQMNLDRLRQIEEQRSKVTNQRQLHIFDKEITDFAGTHWDRHAARDGQGRWNGRQIRNAVQIAASLAWYDSQTDESPGSSDMPPTLRVSHFEIVEKTMTLFDGYMTKTRGGTDGFLARERSERYDKFNDVHSDQRTSFNPDASPSAGHGSGYNRPYGNVTPQHEYQYTQYQQASNPRLGQMQQVGGQGYSPNQNFGYPAGPTTGFAQNQHQHSPSGGPSMSTPQMRFTQPGGYSTIGQEPSQNLQPGASYSMQNTSSASQPLGQDPFVVSQPQAVPVANPGTNYQIIRET